MVTTQAAKKVERNNKKDNTPNVTPTLEIMCKKARTRVKMAGGSSGNELWLLSQNLIYFGMYRGQTFQWLLENCAGYVAGVLASHLFEMKSRKPTYHPDNLTVNKNQLQRYALHYKEMIHEIQNRYRTRQAVREAREAGEDEEGAQPMGMRAVGKDASDSTMTRAQLYHSTDPSDVQHISHLSIIYIQ